eukprot:m.338845 g.338845  ORF g.338845 m.338845 type:complete len:288 (+) comp16087_c0_seq3:5413-6276(+)
MMDKQEPNAQDQAEGTTTDGGNGHGKAKGQDSRKRRPGKGSKPDKKSKGVVLPPNASPMLLTFADYSKTLTAQYDKHERIVKLSRDMTIQSKRLIFALHRMNASTKAKALESADEDLQKIFGLIHQIGKELKDEDPLKFGYAYSPGMQEFIEAYTFLEFHKTGTLAQPGDIEAAFNKDSEAPFALHTTDYVLGIADLSGELMRMCISNMGTPEIPLQIRQFIRSLFEGFGQLQKVVNHREMGKKFSTMKQSLEKVERSCYDIQIQRTEVPQEKLAEALTMAAAASAE